MLLASQLPPGEVSWLPVVLMIVLAIGFAVTNIAASLIIGPKRNGDVKSTTYESGMMPIGSTHKRFNVRFYVVAMIFLVIDVETESLDGLGPSDVGVLVDDDEDPEDDGLRRVADADEVVELLEELVSARRL